MFNTERWGIIDIDIDVAGHLAMIAFIAGIFALAGYKIWLMG